jgi:hypothetical protein
MCINLGKMNVRNDIVFIDDFQCQNNLIFVEDF